MVAGRLGLAAVTAVLQGNGGTMASWLGTAPGGEKTPDPNVSRYPLAQVLEESQALIDGTSPLTQRRVQMMEAIEGVLGL